jgi:hypothetical protein
MKITESKRNEEITSGRERERYIEFGLVVEGNKCM